MSDLIDRQAAIDELNVLCQEHRYKIPGKRETYSQYNEAWQDALDRAEGAIFNLPPVRTEIIHCKDCKFYGRADKRRFYRGSDCLNKRIDTIVPDRDFCSRAEKRGEADGSSNQV